MSTYVWGWIERRGAQGWEGEALDDSVVYPSYDFLGCFFGVRNGGDWDPPFELRGVPDDLAPQTRRAYEPCAADGCSHASFFTCAELAALDVTRAAGDEPARPEDAWRVDRLRVTGDGREVLEEAEVPFSALDDVFGDPDPAAAELLMRHGSVRRGDTVWRCRKRTIADVMGAYRSLFDLLEKESRAWGPENVRVVVWFSY